METFNQKELKKIKEESWGPTSSVCDDCGGESELQFGSSAEGLFDICTAPYFLRRRCKTCKKSQAFRLIPVIPEPIKGGT